MRDILVSLAVAFVCAVGFGIVFGIRAKELWLAGMAGFVTRIVIILCEAAAMGRFTYTFITALVGTLYAELVGRARKSSIAKFMDPAMVLLIPGDILYKMIVSMMKLDSAGITANFVTLMKSLLGIALGCMLGAMVFNVKRRKES